MEPLKIKGSRYVPNVLFDKSANKLEIAGRSCPEDVSAFYTQLLLWLDGYLKSPNPKTVFDFKLTYYNTASAKMLLNLLQKLEEINSSGSQVLVRWYYPEDDEDLEEAGRDYADMVDVTFELIGYPMED